MLLLFVKMRVLILIYSKTQTGKNTWSYVIEEQPEARKTETVMKFINYKLRFEPAISVSCAERIRGFRNYP